MITFDKSIQESKFFASDRNFFMDSKNKDLDGKSYLDYWDKRSHQFEAYWPNNVYGVAKNIKRYITEGTDTNVERHSLPAVTRHGIHFEMYGHKDLHPYEFPTGDESVEFKTALSWPHFMDPIYIRNLGEDKVLKTASPFVYSLENWKRYRSQTQERKGTLFFPRHSTKSRIVVTDYKKMWKQLEELPEYMKPVKVCVFHADVDLGVADDAISRGYETFCCGHVYDQTFHWRLLDLFSTVKYACSQKITSNAIYATLSGVHYFLLDAKMKYINVDQFKILRMKDGDDPQGALQHKRQVTDQFKLLDEDDYPNRLNTAHRLLGYDRKVSPQEYLNQLLELSDRNYTKEQAQKYNLIHPNTI